jgi:hypothetical protein
VQYFSWKFHLYVYFPSIDHIFWRKIFLIAWEFQYTWGEVHVYMPVTWATTVIQKTEQVGSWIFILYCRFYTLMVLSTALFGKPAFRNLICNGLVLAEDGKKMSKSLKNYPSPMEVINDYGAVSSFYNMLISFF